MKNFTLRSLLIGLVLSAAAAGSGTMNVLLGANRSAFTPVTVTYSTGSGTETVPVGATNCIIELWGPGGIGQAGSGVTPGTGGGGGGYSLRSVAVTGGQTFSYSVASPTPTTVTSAAPVVSMTSNGGANGVSGGAGGTASGGTTNITGGSGAAASGGASPNGGTASGPGAAGNAPGGGGGGGTPPANPGGSGANGLASLHTLEGVMTSLGQARREFTFRIADLVKYINAQGYECAFNEVARSDEQALINAIGPVGRLKVAAACVTAGYSTLADAILNNGKANGVRFSVHQQGLAVDMLLYKNGVYLTATEDYRRFGEWWEKQHTLARWGGRFSSPDGNHFSFEFNGVK